MKKTIITFGAVPIEQYRLGWIPCCDGGAYKLCHKREGVENCAFSPGINKNLCKQISITIERR